MSVSPNLRDKARRAYLEFFDIAESKRRWHWLNDIPWDRLEQPKAPKDTAICIETFCGVELYVPDYVANAFNLTRSIFGHAWFEANWAYEESKHALVFQEYLLRSGLRTPEQYQEYEAKIFGKVWKLPFNTIRQMTCYGALQEMATYLIYSTQYKRYKEEQNEVLKTIFYLVARDEAAHLGFYRQLLQLEFAEDYQGTLEDLAHVVFHFQMPGVGLIPDYDERLKVSGVGISHQQFLQHGLFPTLRHLGTTRSDLVRALRTKQGREGERAQRIDTALRRSVHEEDAHHPRVQALVEEVASRA